ncbi:MAG TPA: ABC transporter ATP-binding protein [Candidatus Avipropionibacterium avicola]|uniref:ABC transporter ATP-binding protein n=1 Tax=Candidatus Avipropionibacterium avicola TaxID=2840701 RepID=A0A9D1GZ70_9ACTN|nr:ABC transporter ATP-binding protein [Candidatus Avipropionibacterium avicola]
MARVGRRVAAQPRHHAPAGARRQSAVGPCAGRGVRLPGLGRRQRWGRHRWSGDVLRSSDHVASASRPAGFRPRLPPDPTRLPAVGGPGAAGRPRSRLTRRSDRPPGGDPRWDRLRGCALHHPGQQQATLRGVSFRLAPGESLALVGSNGAGKTTLVKLLLRLYDPTEGRITLDGRDLRDLDLDELRRRMGVIFQDFGRYELTAGENIGLGDVDRIEDRDAIMAAARAGGAADLVDGLPNHLDTALGRELGDRELSGGQWQRIALSRAFMADNELLVLDEPTAELDPRGEHEVFQRFAELTQDRMTILVSHRFSTVRMADRILLLADGVVVESGDHATLMKRDGDYARMFRLQASQYVDQDSPRRLDSEEGPR